MVVGLRAEARLLAGWGLPVAIGGGTAAGAEAAVGRLAAEVDAIISFGLAGGLDPALRPGALVVPSLVVEGAFRWDTDPGLNRRLGGSTGHCLLGGGAVLATSEAKRHARARFGADAVDLESAAVARAATRLGLPFAVLRAVCDPAEQALPRAALVALDPSGRIGALRVALAVLRHPSEVPTLLALGRHAAGARRALLARVGETRAAVGGSGAWDRVGT